MLPTLSAGAFALALLLCALVAAMISPDSGAFPFLAIVAVAALVGLGRSVLHIDAA